MKTIRAGTSVTRGHYLKTGCWTLHSVERDGEALPGGEGDSYVEVPLPIAFAVGPFMGAAFLAFLPLVGFIEAAEAVAGPVSRMLGRSATGLAATLQPGWQPGEAHLTGRWTDEESAAGTAPAATEDDITALEQEIADRRRSR